MLTKKNNIDGQFTRREQHAFEHLVMWTAFDDEQVLELESNSVYKEKADITRIITSDRCVRRSIIEYLIDNEYKFHEINDQRCIQNIMNNCKYETIKRFLEHPNVIVNSLIDCEPMCSIDINKKMELIWHYKLIPYQFSSPYSE